ncbi:MAG: winged helix-turn-helix domain-containing protein, partial [Snowella sp.]
IRATPGPTTSERISTLLSANPQGLSVKELSQELNRPFSMVQHCLKSLMAAQSVAVRWGEKGRYWTYYCLADRN